VVLIYWSAQILFLIRPASQSLTRSATGLTDEGASTVLEDQDHYSAKTGRRMQKSFQILVILNKIPVSDIWEVLKGLLYLQQLRVSQCWETISILSKFAVAGFTPMQGYFLNLQLRVTPQCKDILWIRSCGLCPGAKILCNVTIMFLCMFKPAVILATMYVVREKFLIFK